jgi:hypothetical protein
MTRFSKTYAMLLALAFFSQACSANPQPVAVEAKSLPTAVAATNSPTPTKVDQLTKITAVESTPSPISPSVTITAVEGDRFRAVLACKEHTFCDVEFVLNFSNEEGSAGLKNWRYLFAEEPLVVDYPLDALAGETVQFHLNVRARGNPVEAYAVWIAPHIYRPAP